MPSAYSHLALRNTAPSPSRGLGVPPILAAALLAAFLAAAFTPPARAQSPNPIDPLDPEQSLYTILIDSPSTATESFNYAAQLTHTIELSGKVVLLEAGSPKSNLFDTLNGRTDIKELAIYAEQVIIRNRLALPSASIDIYANELRFEDRPGLLDKAQFDLTPVRLTDRPAETQDGADGLPGPVARLRLVSLYADPGSVPRFVLRGGDGQPAGLGRDGKDGDDMAEYDGEPGFGVDDGAWPDGTVWIYMKFGKDQLSMFPSEEKPNPEWPENGKPAVPAGRPGNGGAGGNIYAPISIWSCDLAGGAPGEKGLDTQGGAPGDPVVARHTEYFQSYPGAPVRLIERASHTSQPGAPASAPDAANGPGASGAVHPEYLDRAAYHPMLARGIIAYARAAKAAHRPDISTPLLEQHLTLIESYMRTAEFPTLTAAQQAETTQLRQTLLDLHRNAAQNWTTYD